MTVSAQPARKLISGSGWANPLTFDLHVENAADLDVYADGAQLALGADYSVAGVGSGSVSVTIVNPLNWAPVNWVLVHTPPMNQQGDLSLGGRFGTAYEEVADAIVRRLQSLEDSVGRAFKRSVTVAGGVSGTLPGVEDDVVAFTADGSLKSSGLSYLALSGSAAAAIIAADEAAISAAIAEAAKNDTIQLATPADGTVSRPKLASTAYSTEAEAEAGTLATGVLTPLRLTQRLKNDGFLPARSFGIKYVGEVGGDADQSVVMAAGLAEIAALGNGSMLLPPGKSVRISQNLTVPDGVSIFSEAAQSGSLENAEILALGAGIQLEYGATLFLRNGSRLKGLKIMPSSITTRQTAAMIPAWLGQAVTLVSSTSDQQIDECFIAGYDKAVGREAGTIGLTRVKMRNGLIDCINGIDFSDDYDVPRIEGVHSYPILSYGTDAADADFLRPGIAFRSGAINDWGYFLNCFDFGHFWGFRIDGSAHFQVINCGADHVPSLGNNGSIGYQIMGGAVATQLIGCKVAGRTHGVLVDNNSAYSTRISGLTAWGNTAGVSVVQGQVTLTDPLIHDGRAGVTPLGVQTTSATAVVRSKGGRIQGVTQAFARPGSLGKIFVDDTEIASDVTTPYFNPYRPTVAAVDGLSVPTGEGGVIIVSNTTGAAITIGALLNYAKHGNDIVTLLIEGNANVQFNDSATIAVDAPGVIIKPGGSITFGATPTHWAMIAKNTRA